MLKKQSSNRKRQANFGRSGIAALALLLLTALTGCEQDETFGADSPDSDKMSGNHIQKLKLGPSMVARKDVATGKAVSYTALPDAPSSLRGIVPGAYGKIHTTDYVTGHADRLGRPRGADSDYIDKADVYWKLNWLRKHFGDQILPNDFEKAIKIAREILTTAQRDANYQITDEALTRVENGLKHYRAAQILKQGGISGSLIPWSAGADAVQRSIDNGALGFGEKSVAAVRVSSRSGADDATRRDATPTTFILSPAQQKILDTVLDYARRYRASPDAMRQREWNAALVKINKLRDELGLKGRDENREDTYESAVSDMGGVDGIVPIPATSDDPTGKMPGK